MNVIRKEGKIMCSQSCLCNSCYTKNSCSNCIYSKESPVSYCYYSGIQKCSHYRPFGTKLITENKEKILFKADNFIADSQQIIEQFTS